MCAQLCRDGSALCDVGTDHAYLPIWLLKAGRVPKALACDIRPGPLENAGRNARRYGVEDRLSLRLSDGLREVRPEEAETVVVAGMGGEVILRIVAETSWLREPGRLLVLQPMSSASDLRLGLRELCFEVLEERAVTDGGRPYTAFSACYGGTRPETVPLYPYIGKLRPGTEAARLYAEKTVRDLRGRLAGAVRGRGDEDPEALRGAIAEIEKSFL